MHGRGKLEPAIAVGIRAGERKVCAGGRVQNVRLGHRRAHRAALETQLEAQLLDGREHRAQLGRGFLVAAQLGGALLTRYSPAGVAEPHVPPLNVGSVGLAGGSCNGVAIASEPAGRAVRRCCFSSWRAFLLSSFCFFAWR